MNLFRRRELMRQCRQGHFGRSKIDEHRGNTECQHLGEVAILSLGYKDTPERCHLHQLLNLGQEIKIYHHHFASCRAAVMFLGLTKNVSYQELIQVLPLTLLCAIKKVGFTCSKLSFICKMGAMNCYRREGSVHSSLLLPSVDVCVDVSQPPQLGRAIWLSSGWWKPGKAVDSSYIQALDQARIFPWILPLCMHFLSLSPAGGYRTHMLPLAAHILT